MKSKIEVLNERDDVAKTEYQQYRADEGEVTVELWHDTESLQRIAERVITGTTLSQKGMEKMAKDEALATRETRIDLSERLDILYPKTVNEFEE